MTNKWTMIAPCSTEQLHNMYVEQKLSTTSIAKRLGCSQGKVSAWLRRFGITLRKKGFPAPACGNKNPKWKGDEASYSALHYRVVVARGKPQLCEECGETEGIMQWSNLNGNYADINDYARLCIRCHRRIDLERRIETDEMTCGSADGKFRHAPRCILTKEQATEAKQLKHDGWTYKQLGVRYGVTPQAIWRIITGKTWKHLTE